MRRKKRKSHYEAFSRGKFKAAEAIFILHTYKIQTYIKSYQIFQLVPFFFLYIRLCMHDNRNHNNNNSNDNLHSI